jgi:hypothetical protein
MAKDVKICPNCFSKNIISDEEVAKIEHAKLVKYLEDKTKEMLHQIERFEVVGRYEDAALLLRNLECGTKQVKKEEKEEPAISSQLI